MTYALSFALQEAVYAALTGSGELAALVGGRIFDSPPHADAPEAEAGPFVTLGEERAEAWGAQGLSGAEHEIEVSVHAGPEGFAAAKRAAAAVAEALVEALPPLATGRVATADFLGARARRAKDGGRRIDLRFRFKVEL